VLANDIFSASVKGLANKVVAVINAAFHSYKDVTGFDKTGVGAKTHRIV